MSDPPAVNHVPISGVPDGLVATAIPRSDGTAQRDRRGRLKVTQVRLSRNETSTPTPPGEPVNEIAPADLRWITARSQRRWTSILQRFGSNAREAATRLAAAGVVDLVCTVNDDLHLGDIKSWQLTPAWDDFRRTSAAHSTDHIDAWRDRADAAAERVRATDPALATALASLRATNPRLQVLVYAAEDLAAGVSHDGPRAFSQAHFQRTKDRDDVAQVLADAGASPTTLVTLGLRRSPYVGLGGPIVITTSRGQFHLTDADGPVLFRADQRRDLATTVDHSVRVLAVIENLQAAEAVCDTNPDLAVLWCAGQPSKATLRTIAGLGGDVRQVLIATDADLGGVRIAHRISATLVDHPRVTILDPGSQPHQRREPFGPLSLKGLTVAAQQEDSVGAFAQACLKRGYPVEQEATIRSALMHHLDQTRLCSAPSEDAGPDDLA